MTSKKEQIEKKLQECYDPFYGNRKHATGEIVAIYNFCRDMVIREENINFEITEPTIDQCKEVGLLVIWYDDKEHEQEDCHELVTYKDVMDEAHGKWKATV